MSIKGLNESEKAAKALMEVVTVQLEMVVEQLI